MAVQSPEDLADRRNLGYLRRRKKSHSIAEVGVRAAVSRLTGVGYTSAMKWMVSLLLLMLWLPLQGQERLAKGPAPAPAGKGSQERLSTALEWDRDFDLLLEVENQPTRAQLLLASRIEGLEKQEESLSQQLADLKARTAALEGTYTTEALLKEMLRQGVSDLQSVQRNLKNDTDRTQARLLEVQAELARLRREAGR